MSAFISPWSHSIPRGDSPDLVSVSVDDQRVGSAQGAHLPDELRSGSQNDVKLRKLLACEVIYAFARTSRDTAAFDSDSICRWIAKTLHPECPQPMNSVRHSWIRLRGSGRSNSYLISIR